MGQDVKQVTGPVVIDPRQPRLGQAITGATLLVGFVLDWRPVLPLMAAVLAAASLIGPRANVYVYLFRWGKRVLPVGPPRELEEPAPPRFANTVGFVFLTVASLLAFGWDADVAAWTLGLIVSALALLAAVTGLCVGCEIFVVARRLATGGRVPGKLTVPVRRGGAAA